MSGKVGAFEQSARGGSDLARAGRLVMGLPSVGGAGLMGRAVKVLSLDELKEAATGMSSKKAIAQVYIPAFDNSVEGACWQTAKGILALISEQNYHGPEAPRFHEVLSKRIEAMPDVPARASFLQFFRYHPDFLRMPGQIPPPPQYKPKAAGAEAGSGGPAVLSPRPASAAAAVSPSQAVVDGGSPEDNDSEAQGDSLLRRKWRGRH